MLDTIEDAAVMRTVPIGTLWAHGSAALLAGWPARSGEPCGGWRMYAVDKKAIYTTGPHRSAQRRGRGQNGWLTEPRSSVRRGPGCRRLVQRSASHRWRALPSSPLVLDGVDGGVARRPERSQPWGRAATWRSTLLLCEVTRSIGAPWVIAIGAHGICRAPARCAVAGRTRPPRYGANPLRERECDHRRRRAPVPAAMRAAIAVALILLAESVGRDVLWQWRQRRPIVSVG